MTEINPHHYAVAAQMIAAHADHLGDLYVSVTPDCIQVQADHTLPMQQRVDALRRFARRLGVFVTASEPITTRSWAENYTYRAYELRADYDGVAVHGFVHERVADVGRLDEVRNDAPINVVGGAA